MFEDIRENITRRFRDLKIWVTSVPVDQSTSEFRSICYGLFFTYIYGLYEEIIRNIISATITELNNTFINIDQCIFSLYPLLFSPEYDALYNVGNEHKWDRRWAISDKLTHNPQIAIPGDLFPTDGKNLRYRQLDSLSKSFGITANVLPRQEVGGYIQEMVDNRNDIAHGNKLPKEVGRGFTKDELIMRCDCISEVCSYICDVYDSYIQDKKYLR